MKYNDKFFYKLVRPIVTILFKFLYRPTIIGAENIPKDKKIILAGNHTSKLDPLLLMSVTKRNIHFLAKIELFRGPKKIIFNNLGLISVDRTKKDKSALENAEKYLKNNCVVLIFPEGTTEKGKKELLPFKTGTVRLSHKTNTEILPFKIIGEYKPFKKSIKIIFLDKFIATEDIENSNDKLKNIINNIGSDDDE